MSRNTEQIEVIFTISKCYAMEAVICDINKTYSKYRINNF